MRASTARVPTARVVVVVALVVALVSRLHPVAASSSVASPSPSPPPPPWGLDRIDQRDLPLDNAPFLPSDAAATATATATASPRDCPGLGVHVFVLDSGLDAEHVAFAGRVGVGYDAREDAAAAAADIDDEFEFADARTDWRPIDAHGHGTHVASVATGFGLGVARCATTHPVRVFNADGRGTTARVLDGLRWVADRVKNGTSGGALRPAVALLSIGGTRSSVLNAAVDALSDASDVVVVVAAGNQGEDACAHSPASSRRAIAVGAVDATDRRLGFSNYGPCVDVFAPGTDVRGAVSASVSAVGHGGEENATRLARGTSTAAPFVAGVAAVFLSHVPRASAEETRTAVLDGAAVGVVRDAGEGSPNRLVNVRGALAAAKAATRPPPPPPVKRLWRLGMFGDVAASF